MAASAPPPLTAERTHRQIGNVKFLMVEDREENNLVRREAYFNEAVEGVQTSYDHLLESPEYHLTNFWEVEEGFLQTNAGFPLPPGVEYQNWIPERENLPHIRTKKQRNYNEVPKNDKNWLSNCLKINFTRFKYPEMCEGRSGIFYHGGIDPEGDQAPSEFADDIRRELTAPVHPAIQQPIVVIKTYHTDGMTVPGQMDRLYEETLAHIELKHPNIVETYAVRFLVDKKGQLNEDGSINALDGQTDIHSFIVMEFSELGSLDMLLNNLKENESDFDFYHLHLLDIVAGLVYLHSTGRAHREFNHSNCLAVKTSKDRITGAATTSEYNCVIKICDFTYTKRFEDQELLKAWQSMDVMDFARMIVWQMRKFFDKDKYQQLRKDLNLLIKFLMRETVDERLANLNRLVTRSEDYRQQDYRQFINGVVRDYFQQKSEAQ